MPDYNRNLQIELGTISDRFSINVLSKINKSNCNAETKQLISDISEDFKSALKDICLVISQYHN